MNRILTTHVGSLIRPPELIPFLEAMDRGETYDHETFGVLLSEAVDEVVHRQQEIGIDIVDDGEFSKVSWITYLYDRVSGIEPRSVPLGATNTLPPDLDREAFAEYYEGHDVAQAPEVSLDSLTTAHGEHAAGSHSVGDGKLWVCTGPLQYERSALDRDIANLRHAVANDIDAFLPVVAPASVYWIENEHYASEEEFIFALADVMREEYRAIVDAGFLVQVDDAVLWHKYGTMRLLGDSREDYQRWAELRVDALNQALAGIPKDRVRYHVCCGSWHGAHAYDPSLADVIDLVLRVNAGTYLIEQGNARHEHEWRLWEEITLPDDKILAPGVITHHTEMVEHPELVSQRIVRLAELVGRERVIASADCGFAQGAFTHRVPLWTQWAKLEALAEGARLATKELWGARAEVA
jgi:5-methyltetrahydropteroyltriglutamate--homocysteine methyltransferase